MFLTGRKLVNLRPAVFAIDSQGQADPVTGGGTRGKDERPTGSTRKILSKTRCRKDTQVWTPLRSSIIGKMSKAFWRGKEPNSSIPILRGRNPQKVTH